MAELLPGPSPTPDGPRLCVCGKQALTRDGAHTAARNLNSHQQNDHWPVHAYACPDSASWHVGHIPKRHRKRDGWRDRPTGMRPRPVTPRDQLPPELR